jgi:hypothetical protein
VSGGLKGFKPDGARWPVLRHGLIFSQDASVACFVLNRSRGGAGLVLQRDVSLPRLFDLEIDGENMRRRCLLVWRDQCRIGVSFDMERAAEIAQDDGPVEQSARPRRALLGREHSPSHLASVLRFVGLADKAVVLAGTDAPPASECRDLPDRFGAGRG